MDEWCFVFEGIFFSILLNEYFNLNFNDRKNWMFNNIRNILLQKIEFKTYIFDKTLPLMKSVSCMCSSFQFYPYIKYKLLRKKEREK